ncbi:Copper transporter MctB precursor [Nocardioides dokdonensis FR1436]|uniref:Copper transporter MctB n=1 Tax=Nocardioides dokdonensis FR1436 TaxID=1300347 RepID=A0A1A9GN31_9ACTN|nr:copper transporter [Nocardioides dokdonensis]ANH39486.1 Copper transporter MctB precursor [Nocardioides dokdonensis FR1436]
MITYRHHIVSLVAVFLALAVGIAVGGGPLADPDRTDAAAAPADTGSEQVGLVSAYADSFATSGAARLLGQRLEDRSVALLTTGGVEEEVVVALTGQIEAAGGSVTARYELLDRLVGGSSTSLVDTLGARLADEVDDGAVDPDAAAYDRMGQLLGLAVSTSAPDGTPAGAGTSTLRQGLAGADLVSSSDPEAPRAPLVLLVLGEDTDPDVLAGLVSGVATVAGGTVVAAASDSAEDGTLAALREAGTPGGVVSVDGVESALGHVSTALALLVATSGAGGDFGPHGADGAVPVP